MRFAKSAALAGAIAVMACAAPSALGAVAAVEDDQLVSAPIDSLESRMDQLQASGTRFTRFGILWNEVAPTRPANPTDPNDPAYDWTRTDMIVRGLAKRGINGMVMVYSSPSWTAGRRDPTHQYNPWVPAAGDYGKFMQAAATRYSGRFVPIAASGDGTATGTTSAPVAPGTPLPRIKVWEVWNEPNLPIFFKPTGARALPNYIRLLREAYPAVKRANPQAVVIAGAAGPRGGGPSSGGVGADFWLRGLVRAPLTVKFDAYSQHIYPAVGPTAKKKVFPSWGSINDILAVLDQRRDREIAAARGAAAKAKVRRAPKMKLFITEAGYTTKVTPFRNVKVTEAQQALYLRQIFGLRQLRTPRVPVVMWFNLQDNTDWPGGLLTETWSTKPSFNAFRGVARRGGLPPELRR